VQIEAAKDRFLRIRRRKMLKFKRLKRRKRDAFKYAKYHRAKKTKSEAAFRARVSVLFDELDSFDADKYVRETIDMSHRTTERVSYSGKRLHPHWSTLISIEELYDLPNTDYIDKRGGLPSDEDLAEIRRLQDEYNRKYCRIDDKKKKKND